jgi:hypothetical protein
MGALFAELANVQTAMGELSLRRRREPTRQVTCSRASSVTST